MAYEQNKLRLRRFETQINHHSAFLFWNLKGVMAEKWAHGPHFGAYQQEPDRLVLTKKAGQPSDLVAICTLKGSAFISEDMLYPKIQPLVESWFADCIEVFQPRVVNTLNQKVFYAYPVKDAEKVNGLVLKQYPGLGTFPPDDYEERFAAAQFQVRRTEKGEHITTPGIFGMYSPEQSKILFSTRVADFDEQWNLGLSYETTRTSQPKGFDEPMGALNRFLDAAYKESKQLVNRTIARVLNSA